jgi:cell division transport system permease protein
MLKFWQHRFDVPFNQDMAHRFIPWVIGLMIFLATLALVLAATVGAIVKKWDQSYTAGFTVELANMDTSNPQYLAMDIERQRKAVKILHNTVGVSNADVISKTAIKAFLDPHSELLHEGTSPTLIDVEVRDGYKINLKTLSDQLNQAVPGTIIRDRGEWREKALQVANSVIWISIIMASFIGLSAILTIAFMTYTGLEAHHSIIEVLHLIGARNYYIARQFQEHALQLAIKGGLFGILLSTVVLFMMYSLLVRLQIPYVSDGIPTIEICIIVMLTPLIGLILTAFSARLTVVSTLAKRVASS